MHGEYLIVPVRVDKTRFGRCQLQAHDESKQAAKYQEHEGRDDISPGYHLVVDSTNRAPETAARPPCCFERALHAGNRQIGIHEDGGLFFRHQSSPSI